KPEPTPNTGESGKGGDQTTQPEPKPEPTPTPNPGQGGTSTKPGMKTPKTPEESAKQLNKQTNQKLTNSEMNEMNSELKDLKPNTGKEMIVDGEAKSDKDEKVKSYNKLTKELSSPKSEFPIAKDVVYTDMVNNTPSKNLEKELEMSAKYGNQESPSFIGELSKEFKENKKSDATSSKTSGAENPEKEAKLKKQDNQTLSASLFEPKSSNAKLTQGDGVGKEKEEDPLKSQGFLDNKGEEKQLDESKNSEREARLQKQQNDSQSAEITEKPQTVPSTEKKATEDGQSEPADLAGLNPNNSDTAMVVTDNQERPAKPANDSNTQTSSAEVSRNN
ncbi:hypothetical protein, partial [Mycoplasma leonicaptivi]|uniref:hypothetical protein n=1 Tax=Mycoplasma leonicaptivi TaxID=36742 RepID=UPI000569B792